MIFLGLNNYPKIMKIILPLSYHVMNLYKNFEEKVYLTPSPFILGLLHPPTMKPSVLPPELSKTVYFTPWAVFDSGFATVTLGLLQ